MEPDGLSRIRSPVILQIRAPEGGIVADVDSPAARRMSRMVEPGHSRRKSHRTRERRRLVRSTTADAVAWRFRCAESQAPRSERRRRARNDPHPYETEPGTLLSIGTSFRHRATMPEPPCRGQHDPGHVHRQAIAMTPDTFIARRQP